MPNYRRLQIPGSTWFFTVNLLQRHNNNLLIEKVTALKSCIKKVHRARLFENRYELKMASAVFGKGIAESTGYATNMLKQEFIPQTGAGITASVHAMDV